MKIFVVTNHYETGDNASTTTVVGTFSTMEKAQAAMKKEFNWEKENNFSEDFEYDECDVQEFDDHCSIFNNEIDGHHYVSINITETELQ